MHVPSPSGGSSPRLSPHPGAPASRFAAGARRRGFSASCPELTALVGRGASPPPRPAAGVAGARPAAPACGRPDDAGSDAAARPPPPAAARRRASAGEPDIRVPSERTLSARMATLPPRRLPAVVQVRTWTPLRQLAERRMTAVALADAIAAALEPFVRDGQQSVRAALCGWGAALVEVLVEQPGRRAGVQCHLDRRLGCLLQRR